jgi:uncharacterized membrane protein YhfC
MEIIASFLLTLGNNLLLQVNQKRSTLELTDIVDFATGIFAAFLMMLSLIAYKNTKSKRLLFASTAFGLFALRAIIASMYVFIPEAQSTAIELTFALTGFAILSLFFLAIVKKM